MSSSRDSSPVRSLAVNLEDPHVAATEVARLKRKLKASQQQLAEATNTRKKKSVTVKTMGRGIRKVVSLFESVSSIVDEADRRTLEEDPDANEPDLTDSDDSIKWSQDRTFTAYNLLLRLVPLLKSVIQDPDLSALDTFLADLQEGANGAHSEDIKRIKEELGTWVNVDYNPSILLVPKTRQGRGLQHNICGELLTPIEFNWHDTNVRANIRNGNEDFFIGDNYFVNCLYPKGHADPDFVERGFLKSRLLLQVYCCIFTSPSSAEGFEDETEDGPTRKKLKTGEQKKATKSHVASLLNMDGKVTGRSIAYAAVLLVFNLTNAEAWVETFNGFNFIAFYNFLVDYFEESCDTVSRRRIDNLLSWWNSQVFPHHVDAIDSNKSRNKLAAQRARALQH